MAALVLLAAVDPVSAAPIGPAQLQSALSRARGGERIELSAGDYGALRIENRRYPSDVTLVSADRSNPAVVRGLSLRNSSHLVLDGLRFQYGYRPGTPDEFAQFKVNRSSNITIRNSVFVGDLSPTAFGKFPSGVGLDVSDTAQVVIEQNEFNKWWRALALSRVSGATIRANDIHDMRSDGVTFAQASGVVIEGNHIHDFLSENRLKDHRDLIQFWTFNQKGPTRDVTIRDNFLDAGTGTFSHTIFMRNEAVDQQNQGPAMFYRNIAIENNVVYTSHVNGMWIGETSGLTIRNNTMLYDTFAVGVGVHPAAVPPKIMVKPASVNVTIEGNISHYDIRGEPGWKVGNNLIVQRDHPGVNTYYGKLFVNALVRKPKLADLRAIAGGLIDQKKLGAAMTRYNTDLEVGPVAAK